jgi:exopolysaccharide biosynthesis polyprenyl glycosylphosphotransferase
MKNKARTLLLLLGDIVALYLAFCTMITLAKTRGLSMEILQQHFVPFSILSILWLIVFFIFNLYDREKSKPTIPHLNQIINAFIFNAILGIVFFYITSFFVITPKTNLFIFSLASLIFFILWRRIFYNIFSAHFKRDVIFINNGEENNFNMQEIKNYMTTYPQSGFNVLGEYTSISQFFEQKTKIPQVFIVKNGWGEFKNFKEIQESGTQILDLSYAYEDILGSIPVDIIDESWFMHNVLSNQENNYLDTTRIIGVLFAAIILVITSPFLLIIGIAIKFYDDGPIFYSQTRIGKNRRKFTLYKFRSMVVDAEKNGPEWSKEKDSRITPVGRIIRKLHIDEIPQMLNIIKGDIDLVGPRPERPEFVEELEKEIPFYYLRHTITPGFTGWAQIKFRYAGNVMDSKKKFEYDLYYLKNKNIFMDLGILVRTVQIVFTH